jgi:hypothetical protein
MHNVFMERMEEPDDTINEIESKLVVTEETNTDFVTQITGQDGSVINEEIHTHHVRKVLPLKENNTLIITPAELVVPKYNEVRNESFTFNGGSGSATKTVDHDDHGINVKAASHKKNELLRKMIEIRDALETVINEVESTSHRDDDEEITARSSLLEEVLRMAATSISQDERLKVRIKRDALGKAFAIANTTDVMKIHYPCSTLTDGFHHQIHIEHASTSTFLDLILMMTLNCFYLTGTSNNK